MKSSHFDKNLMMPFKNFIARKWHSPFFLTNRASSSSVNTIMHLHPILFTLATLLYRVSAAAPCTGKGCNLIRQPKKPKSLPPTHKPTVSPAPTLSPTNSPTASPTTVASVDDATFTALITTGENRYIPPGPDDIRGPCPALNTLANHGFVNRNGRNISQEDIQNALTLAYKFVPQDNLVHIFERGFGFSSFTGSNGINQTDLHLIASHHISAEPLGRIIEHDSSLTRLDSTVEGGGEGLSPQIPINPKFLATFLNTPATLNKNHFDVEVMYNARVVSLARSYRMKGLCGRNVASVDNEGIFSNIDGYYFNNSFSNPAEAFPSFIEAGFVLMIFGGRQGVMPGYNNHTASIEFVRSFFQFETFPAGYLRATNLFQLTDVIALADAIYSYGPQISPPPCM
jgi:hypothetical protein